MSTCQPISGMKMFQLLMKFQLFHSKLYILQSSNYTCNVNYFCGKLFAIKDNIFLYNQIMKLLHFLSVLCIFCEGNQILLLKSPVALYYIFTTLLKASGFLEIFCFHPCLLVSFYKKSSSRHS